jgi:hypothetical protein
MEVQDGFIVGIYNYCDRWCECCRFTSRCRLFADHAMHEATASGDLKEVAEAPQHPSDYRPPPKWLEEALADFDESKLPELPPRPPLPARHAEAVRCAKHYMLGVSRWIESSAVSDSNDPRDPLAVVIHFPGLIASKTHRAMRGLVEDDGDRDFPPDFEGSGKVVVDGIERSISAWKELGAQGQASPPIVTAFIAELQWLLGEIDHLVPNARTFVRAGIDEPDEVRKLEAVDWS